MWPSSHGGSRTGSRIGSRYIGSGKVSGPGSRGSGSRPTSSRASKGAIEGEEGEDPDGEAETVMNLKGLPPSEAMLSRKQFRACSVDLSIDNPKQLEILQSNLPKELLEHMEPISPSGDASSSKAEPPQRHGILPPLSPTAPPRKGGSDDPSPAKRKVKPAQDSLVIVTDAIARLSEVERNRDTDADDEEGGGGAQLRERLPTMAEVEENFERNRSTDADDEDGGRDEQNRDGSS